VSDLVLDTSALVAYASGSIDVGEPITEVANEGGRVVIPVVCLIEAAQSADEAMLNMLVGHSGCDVVPLTVDAWPAVAAGYRVLGRLDLSVALYLATTRNGFLLTHEPDAYGAPGEDTVIGF
jgi:hypothetical protein